MTAFNTSFVSSPAFAASRADKKVASSSQFNNYLGSGKTSFATALICSICSCKFAKACDWHLWHCTKHDEQVSEQSTCPDWEED